MARYLALEWDAREARVAIARPRGSEFVVEEAFSIDLTAREGEEVDVGARLSAALAGQDLRRLETLVAVGRANIELRVLSVPPVPDEELPDIVRFQAVKQFTTMGENWPLDFVPLEKSDESQSVLAAAIAPDLVDQIRKTCKVAGLSPKRLVLRPFAAAALWRRRKHDQRCTLIIDMLIEDADLTVLADGQVVFTRTVRLPQGADEEATARVLSGEMRRTIAAAQNQLAGKRVESVVFCGDNEAQAGLRSQVQQQLSLEVQYFDPFEGVATADRLAAKGPDHPGRYAPLLGLLAVESAQEQHALDFLNPRKKPAPKSNRRQYSLIAAVVALTLLLATGWVWNELSALDSRILSLRGENTQMDSELKKLKKIGEEVAKIDEFTRTDINWLDELYRLSTKYLPADDSLVAEINMLAGGRSGGGQTTIEGFVRQSNLIDELQNRLRDEKHQVSNTGSSFDEKQDVYRWRYTETIVTAPENPETRFILANLDDADSPDAEATKSQGTSSEAAGSQTSDDGEGGSEAKATKESGRKGEPADNAKTSRTRRGTSSSRPRSGTERPGRTQTPPGGGS